METIEIKTYYSEDLRKDMLELSDDRVLWKLTAGFDEDTWWMLVESERRRFMVNFGVPVYTVGRSGRHVCVDDNHENRKFYNRMVKYVEDTQRAMIEAWNNGDREAKY